MKPSRREPSAPKVVNGRAPRPPAWTITEGQLLRYPSLKPFTDLDREFGPWVRGPGGQWWRAKRL